MPRNRREIAYSDFNLDDPRVDEADPLTILMAIESVDQHKDWLPAAAQDLTLEEYTALCRGENVSEF